MPSGSPPRSSPRPRVEDQIGLNTRAMHRRLTPGIRFTVNWSWGDTYLAAVDLTVGESYVDVVAAEGLPTAASTTITLAELPCPYGGRQIYFLCPLCGSQRVWVYWDQGDGWGCRGCLRLAYATEQMGVTRRKFAKMYRLADQVGLDLATGRLIGVKGQHAATRERLLREYEAVVREVLGVRPVPM